MMSLQARWRSTSVIAVVTVVTVMLVNGADGHSLVAANGRGSARVPVVNVDLHLLPVSLATSSSNPGQPTLSVGATGTAVQRLQRALRRTAAFTLAVDGVFGAQTQASVRSFQASARLTPDGVVGPLTWGALPDGGPMPVLTQGASGNVVRSLQVILTRGVANWGVSPGGADGIFGPATQASVQAFQRWAGIPSSGVVSDQTWLASLHAASATLESAVGLQYVIG